MAPTRRQMIFVPGLYPKSFVFLYQKGADGSSWSIRDFSVPHSVSGPRYAREFDFSLDELARRTVKSVDAPVHTISDLDFWHQFTLELNRTHLGKHAMSAPSRTSAEVTRPVGDLPRTFPIFDQPSFDRHRKSRKTGDRDRILTSKNSEDWVTWTALQLLKHYTPDTWWAHFVAHARVYNPSLTLPNGWEQVPELLLWEAVPAPEGYERSSRERLRTSGNSKWAERSLDPRPVEGRSEIDVVIRNDTILLFVEAKLGSDISPKTSYDPRRNQIARNIDCVLDQGANRTPLFWLLVRDAGSMRSYTQMLAHYRDDPEALIRELPHYEPERITGIAQNLSLVLWKDLVLEIVPLAQRESDSRTKAIWDELWQRINIG